MYQHLRAAVSTVAILQLFACTTPISAETDALYTRLNGVFVSDGYGYVIDLSGDTRAIYHLSNDVCVHDKASSAEIHNLIVPETVFETADGQEFSFGIAYEPHKIKFQRVETLPLACATPAPNTLEGNFDAFAAMFSAHYAFFDVYKTDWAETVKAGRAKLDGITTEEELFALFDEMIAPLEDGHLKLDAEINGVDFSVNPITTALSRGAGHQAAQRGISKQEVLLNALDNYWKQGVAKSILGGKGHETAGGKIQYGIIDNTIGYINVLMLAGYTSDELFSDPEGADDQEEKEKINKILDEIITSFTAAKVSSVIIDASLNFGGNDYMGREIAARFADEKRFAYAKSAFGAADVKETPVYIMPSAQPSFDGPVYLMTTDSTVSAGEIMTMSLRALPHVTHVGQPTNGSLSEILNKVLPNGWTLDLSNEIYHDHNGIAWEGPGITPDIPLEIFSETKLLEGHPAAVASLVEQIQSDLKK